MVTAQPVTAEASVVETLLLDLWSRRHDASAIEEICAKLSAAAADAASLSKIELYLPQFAHMVVVLADELPVVVPLERFILTVCQLSIHVAIQFFWLVYASLQENRLKQKSANRATYRRCALLLLQLEQCIVYGGGGGGVAGATDPQRTLLQECARIASASLSASTSGLSEVVHSGLLKKKGGGTSRFGRRSWSTRYFELRDRVLYYYTSASHAHEDKTSSSDRPRGSMQLSSAYVSIPQKKKRAYPNYFEVVDKQSGLVFKLQAPTREAMARWLHTIQVRTACHPAVRVLSASASPALPHDARAPLHTTRARAPARRSRVPHVPARPGGERDARASWHAGEGPGLGRHPCLQEASGGGRQRRR